MDDILKINGSIKARNYWSNRLLNFELNDYFNDSVKRKPAITHGEHESHDILASVSLAASLNEIAPSDKAKHMILLATLGILAKKCSSVDDVAIFTPLYKDKVVSDSDSNLAPVRMNAFSDIDFQGFVKKLKADLPEDLRHSHYPTERILKTTRKELRQLPAVGMMMSMIQYAAAFDHIQPDLLFDFHVNGILKMSVNYDPGRYDLQYVSRIGNMFFSLLEQLIGHKTRDLAKIELISQREKRQRLLDMDRSRVAYPEDKNIIHLFEKQVWLSPDAIALSFEDVHLTYSELDKRSTALGLYLRKKNIGPDVVVGLLADRSIETVVAMLGILKAGGAYMPIDVDYPIDRIKYMIQNSGTPLVLTRRDWYKGEDYAVAIEFLEEMERPTVEAGCLTDDEISIDNINKPSDLCYVIYTSGTTGNPKGVMVEHRNVVRLLFNDEFQFDFGPDDIWTMFHSHCFDMSVWEMYGALLYGGRVIVIPKSTARDTEGYLRLLRREKVTVISQTPSAFYRLSQEELLHAGAELKIRCIVFAGEALSPGRLAGWNARYPRTRLINMYGITETTVHNTFKEIGPVEIETNVGNIGKPIPTLSLYILDRDRNEVPNGIIGELYVGGAGVTRGYINNEKLTSQRFIADPNNDKGRLYRSGDLVRMLDNGDLEYIGRMDTQVQLRGFRVELKEIEHQLCRHENISGCAVLDKGEDADKKLIAYYVSGERLGTNELRNYLLGRLPEYMVPSQWVHLRELPVNANGKLDKRALLKIAEQQDEEYIGPSTPTEVKLVSIWAEVLSLEEKNIGINRSFFVIGGNSLQLVKLSGIINREFSVQLTVGQLFVSNTIQQQAGLVPQAVLSVFENILPRDRKKYHPLSPAQKRLYFLYHFDTRSTAYNMPKAIWLKERPDSSRLENAFRGLIQRHEILRTRFILDNGTPVQEVMDDVDLSLEFIHSSTATLGDDIVKFRRPFQLNTAPLLRAGLIQTEEGFVLVFDIHHIISDGVSQNLMIREFNALYNNDALPATKLHYADYTEWLLSKAQQAAIQKQKEYWVKEFAVIPEPLDLPVDFHRPAEKSFEGDTISFNLKKEHVTSLQQLAAYKDVSMYMLTLSIYQILLAKLANREDVVVGTIMAGRRHADLNAVVGMFVNTIALKNNVPHHLSFDSFVDDLKERTLQAFDNQDYQFEELLDELNLDRNASRNPLFDVVFAYQNAGQATIDIVTDGGKTCTVNHRLSKFDLTLAVNEGENGLSLEFEYRTDLFRPQTIRRFISAFKRIVEQVIGWPEITIGEIELVEAAEKKMLLEGLNFSGVSYPKNRSVISAFEAQVQRSPLSVAVEFRGETVTYKELNTRANQLGHLLMEKGVQPGKAVGLFLDRSIDMIVGILGVLKAGGTYLPIDIASPGKRVDLMLEDCGALMLITTTALTERIATGIDKVLLDTFAGDADPDADADADPHVGLPEGNVCYVIYTSGTTGKPKGVMVTQANLMSLFFNEGFLFDFNQDDVWTMFHRYCFDFSVWEMYGALLFGGRLVLIAGEDTLDPAAFRGILKEKGVTILNQTPTAFYNLSQEEQKYPDALAVRYVIFGGEKLNPKILRYWREKYPETRLINMFGITETTIHVTYKEITPLEIRSNKSVIGKPLPSVSAYLLDRNLLVVPQGFPGELYVGGNGVSAGYINQPVLTSGKFIDNPFQPGDMLYKTGDLVKVNEEGELEYITRIDNQVQVKGFRIELGEIETALTRHRHIKEAKIVYTERNGAGCLIGYYIADADIKSSYLRQLLASSLPAYMIPSYFVRIDKMPLTVNGKVNIDQLPAPDLEKREDLQAPHTKTESKMSEIWANVLGLDYIGVNSNFFASGGDSIMAIRLVTSINKEFASAIKIVDLYNFQTVTELSAYLDTAETKTSGEAYVAIDLSLNEFHSAYVAQHPNEEIEAVYPMSNIEKGMCFVQQKNSDDLYYYEQLVWNIPYADFDHGRLIKAMELMCQKHSAFRTGLDVGAGAHVIYKKVKVTIPYTDLTHLTRQDQETYIQFDMEGSRSEKFNLLKAPLWKMSLYKLETAAHALLFEIHHAVSDGWSIATFQKDLNAAYKELTIDSEYKLVKLGCGYRDFIREEMVYEKQEENLNFWKEELADFTKFDFGIHSTRKNYSSTRIRVENGLFDQLEIVAGKRNVPVKTLFFAAYLYALRLFCYEDDVVVGLVTFNRLVNEDGPNVFGNFLNTIPVRLLFGKDLTCGELLDMVQEKLLRLKPHERSSLFRINSALGAKALNENPIFDTLFNYTNFHVSYELTLEKKAAKDFSRLHIKDFIRGHGLFEVNINGVKGDCFIQYECVSSYIDDRTFEKYHAYYLQILRLLAGSAENDARLVSILDQERAGLLGKCNANAVSFQKGMTLPDLFDHQVEARPEAVAAVWEGKELTYGALSCRANQLAHLLQAQGVGPESLVPLCLDRSLDMIVAIMGVLKAGGAYVPIDPDSPEQRKQFIFQDTGAKLVLTQSKYYPELSGVSGVKLILLDSAHGYRTYPDTPVKTAASAGHLAYMIYTSGTTGQPKGALNQHSGVVNNLVWMQRYLQLSADDVILQNTTYCFDVSGWELLLPLVAGCRMVFSAPRRQGDSRYLHDLIESQRVTTVNFVPSMLSIFLLEAEGRCPSLKHVVCIGEELKRSLVDEFKGKLGHASLYNTYGPTEAAIAVTAARVDPDRTGPVNIGVPIDNTEIYLVDKHGLLQGEGAPGELLIGGVQVGRGYFNRLALTREKFIEDPFSPGTGRRLYKTGDLARWLPDGSLEYLGRIDNQVKIRGYRIEPGEIESQLSLIPGVREAAVVVPKAADGAPYLAGYYTADAPLARGYLQEQLQRRLPGYMVPAYFVHLDKMPLNSNGKLDRKALPDARTAVDDYVGPMNGTEMQVVSIWAEVLQLEPQQISVNTSFFELGGHSLNAPVLTHTIEQEFTVTFPLVDIFLKPTVRLMAEHIDGLRNIA
jgi:tyrocidine synthetase-3